MKKNKKSVLAYLHTHWDAEWYRTKAEFDVRLIRVFDLVLNELKKGNMPSFYFDGQVYALLSYLKFRPENKDLIKDLVKSNKLFIGPFYASVDNFLVSSDALRKNLESGLKISEEFGQKEFLGYLSDTFGHSKSIFKILNEFEIDKAIIWRGAPSFLPADFMVSNTKVTRLIRGYYHDILHTDAEFSKKAELLEKTLDLISKKSGNIILLPIGADHMAPLLNANETINNINKHLNRYEIKLSNPFEYFRKADYSKAEYPDEFLDNSDSFILQGVYSSRIDEKIVNAELQWDLFKKAIPLNNFLNGKYNSELNYASLELIKNHAHDSIYGCSVDGVHKIVRSRQLNVKETIKAVNMNLVLDIRQKYLKEDTFGKALVFNHSKYKQNGIAEIISDKKIKFGQKILDFNWVSDDILSNIFMNPVTEDFHKFSSYFVEIPDIPAYTAQNIQFREPEVCHTIGLDFIENEYIKLFILDNKIFVTDKKAKKTYENFIELHYTKEDGDSYNYAPVEYPKSIKIKDFKIKTKGKIKSTLQIKYENGIKLNVSTANNLEYLEFEADFVNKNKNGKLQFVINTGKKIKETTAEDAIGTIKRHHDPNYLLFENMPANGRYELKTGAYPMQRYVIANKIGIITKGLNEYEVYQNSLKIALLRSIGIISNPLNKARGVPAGPPIKCPDMQCLGRHKMSLAITFEDNIEKIADNFYSPFTAILGDFKEIEQKITV